MDSKPKAGNQAQESGIDEGQSIQINISPEMQRGVFANQALISNTAEEFFLDFILATPPAAAMTARVIITPAHAKRLVTALHENVRNYEVAFGEIKLVPIANDSETEDVSAGRRADKTVN